MIIKNIILLLYCIINKTSILIVLAFDQNIVSLFLFYSVYEINEYFKKKENIILKLYQKNL